MALRITTVLAASLSLIGRADGAKCDGTEPCTTDCSSTCGGGKCFYTLATDACDGVTDNDKTCNTAKFTYTAGYTGGSVTCKESDGKYVAVKASVVQCDDNADNVASNVKTCGCAQNQAVELTTAIAKTEVDVLKTKGSDKIFVAAGTAKKWDAAGFKKDDYVLIEGTNCAALDGGTAVSVKVTQVTADELTVATTPKSADETQSKDCTIRRVEALKCVACASGYIFAQADATPQTSARSCTVKQCDSTNTNCGCATNQAVEKDATKSNNFKCVACAAGYAFKDGDTSPQTAERKCTPNECTGKDPPVTYAGNIVAGDSPKTKTDKINTGDDLTNFIKCATNYVRKPGESTPATAMCATAGANAVTLSGYTCVATCKALSLGANVLAGDTNGCVNSQRLVVSASEATTCSLKCKTGYTASGTATFSCAKGASADANPSSDFACAINQCTKKSGSRDGYACSRATDKNACKDGAAFNDADRIGDVTNGLGKVTCAPGYGAGPKATAAAKDNNPAVVVCNGKAGTSDTAFAFSGCHRFKCNDIEGKGTDKKNFDESKCAAGYKIKANLDIFCEDPTKCESTDCCQDIDECTEKDDAGTAARTDTGGNAKVIHNCHASATCMNADSVVDSFCNETSKKSKSSCLASSPYNVWTENNGNAGSPPAGSNGGSVGTKNSRFTCTCNDGYFGDGTACTACTAVANSVNVTCTTAKNSRAHCVTGSIKVPAASSSSADVCRLECPFVDVMGMIDSLQPTCPSPGASDDAESSKDKCEAVPGCYYTPKDGGTAQSCKVLYTECKKLSASADACTKLDGGAAPRLWGTKKLTDFANQTIPGCVYTAAVAGGDSWDDSKRCDIAPVAIKVPKGTGATSYSTARTPIVRCQALLDTNWAHDLRGSCDASEKCALHDSGAGAKDGLIAKLKLVYADPPGSPPNLAATGADFFTDAKGDTKTTWEVCGEIRDAVNAAPTCSSGAG